MPLLPLKELRRRATEIEATHPQYRGEELPLMLAYKQQRRRHFAGVLVATVPQAVAA